MIPNASEITSQLRELVLRVDFPLFVTLTFNRTMTDENSFSYLNRFHKQCDRKLIGRNHYLKDSTERTFFFAFPEKLLVNRHYHLLLVPAQNRVALFSRVASLVWNGICPSGEVDIRDINSERDRKKIVNYVLKEHWRETNYEQFIVSTQFHY